MVNAFRWMVFVIGLAVVIGSIMVTSAHIDPMIILIDKPSDGETVNTKTITVSGTAEAMEGYIDSVTVNDIPAGIDTWSADIELEDGPNPITVVATDDMGQSSSETITVYYQAPTTSPTQPPIDHEAPSAIPTPTPTGSISITTTPSGAEVDLDNSPTKRITPATLENVTEGQHKIKVSKEGYRIETRKIFLRTDETKELNIELEPITGSIVVYSIPPGASVYFNNVYIKDKITPCMLSEVVVGQHSIKLTKSDYFNETEKVSVSAGRTTHLHENLTKCPRYGSLDISSDPSGAKVYLDDVYTKDTPCMLSEVVVGPHTLKLTKFGYDDEIRKVSISVGETLSLHVKLTGYGSLCISSNPSGASVSLDGVCKGETLLDIPKVVVGSYSIGLTKWGYGDVEKRIHVSAGETTYVDVPFSGGIPPNYEIILMIIVPILLAVIAKMYYKNRPPQGPD